MSFTYLLPQQHYEERYDKSTIESCRSGERMVNGTFATMQEKVPASEFKERQGGWYLLYSQLYFGFVESVAAKRHDEREATIEKWMKEDEAKDRRLANAHLTGGAYCLSCGKDMAVISKDYMHREGHKEDGILIMLECDVCNKRRAFWQDGEEWKPRVILCEKCGGETKSKHVTKGKVITTTRTCKQCGHTEKDVMDLSEDSKATEEPADPYFELDRKRFIFGSDMMAKFRDKKAHLERLQKLVDDGAERIEHADVYDAIKDIQKLKIAQLSELLTPALAKQKYTKFKLGEPQLGREVSLDFSCLDADAGREEYTSKNSLKKLVDKTLIDTNWRLMSEGVRYRLGYLQGRLRAYESEEDLKKLVEKRPEQTQKAVEEPKPPTKQANIPLREAAQVYLHNMTLTHKPAEITLKSGKRKPTSISYIRSEMHPLLRVIIPFRENDEAVPAFIRDFNFMSSSASSIPKVSKDAQGREIRLTETP